MSTQENPDAGRKSWLLSPDSWAVVAALLAALLVRVGILRHIPW